MSVPLTANELGYLQRGFSSHQIGKGRHLPDGALPGFTGDRLLQLGVASGRERNGGLTQLT
jgi:hypothetical protein